MIAVGGVVATLNAQSRLLAALAGRGRVELRDEVVAGMPAQTARPARGAAWPVLVFVNGVTRHGRNHPEVRRGAEQLARAGFLVLVPDLPGLAIGQLGHAALESLVAVARVAMHRQDCRGGCVGLVGVSTGTTFALLAAEDVRIADRITVVAGLAPYADLARIVRLATTGSYLEGGVLQPYPAGPFLSLVVARSLAVGVPGPDGEWMRALLAEVGDDDPDPLAPLRAADPAALGDEAQALRALLVNGDPAQFDRLYAALSTPIRTGVERLSPIAGIGRLCAPAELASAPVDKYFPLAESRELAAASPRVRLTVSGGLGHYRPEVSMAGAAEAIRLNAFGVRVLRAARRC